MKKLLTKSKKKNLLIFLLYPIIASFLSLQLNLNFAWSTVLFFVIPSIHLSILLPRSIKKSLVGSILVGLTSTVIIDVIAHFNETWYVPSVFPFRLFGLSPLEVPLWGISLVYFVLMFYEYFLDTHRDRKLLRPRMKFGYMVMLIPSIAVLFILAFAPRFLNIPFFYLWIGLIFMFLPIILELARKPQLIQKFFLAGTYFFFVFFIHEISAIKLDHWIFPATTSYVGYISIFGITFPFEELFFWMMLSTMAVLSYYEFFDDDEK